VPSAGRKTQSLCLGLIGGVAVALATVVLLPSALPLLGQGEVLDADTTAPAAASVPEAAGDRIAVRADYSQEWIDGTDAVAILRGRCELSQGSARVTAAQMVIRRQRRDDVERLSVYLEQDVRLERPGQSRSETALALHLSARDGIEWNVGRRAENRPAETDPLYVRAIERFRASPRSRVTPTQLVVPEEPEAGPELRMLQIEPPVGNLRRIRISPRSAIPFDFETGLSQQTTPPEQVWILTGGITVIVDGLDELGTVDLSADRAVLWMRSRGLGEFQAETIQTRDEPLTIYLEGNIVIRQDTHVLRATRAVYDVREERALLLDAELRSFIPAFQGDVRVRAAELRQLSQDSFYARNAWTTASQFGVPGYRLQASDVFIENRLVQPFFGLGAVERDPATGAPLLREVPWITSLNNTLFVEEVPVFYLPRISAPADDPGIPLRRATAGQDRIFGFQVRTAWDLYKLAGIDAPAGMSWDLLADFYSERGPAVGTAGNYVGRDLFGVGDTYIGEGLLYYVHDDGEDNLGRDRRRLDPETNDRYLARIRHRHDLNPQLRVFGEIGVLSDRNFLEQYYEDDFDEDKDLETLLYAKQQFGNSAGTLLVRPQVNDFETTTEWLPRADLYLLSEPLLGGWLSWSHHTSAGYGQLRPGDPPSDPRDVFTPLPFVDELEAAVLMSRHELTAPLNLGPLNVVPFALGEAAFWSEGFDGDDIDRFVGSLGVRSSLMAWRVFPYVQSRIFNLNGLAHKVRLEGEYAYTDASEGLANIPQFNEFDDNAQERFRQRFLVNTFGGALPPEFDPRFYAVRSGAGRSVTAPWHELIDDQQVLRLALRQRLQTKVGPPEHLRIKDWMTLDLEASYFPEADEDNFGEDLGLLSARYRWFVGERTSILANALYDVFDPGQELWSLGVLSQRSERGSVYLGVRQIKGGPLDSQILTASYSYRMSPKWVSTLGTAYDLAEDRNAGQSLTVTRIGADWLVHVGAGFDESKDNASIAISVEPRLGPFASQTELNSLLTPQALP
jgi:lipopolysaccharide export system protein LptA